MADLSGGIAPMSPDMQNQAATTDAAPVTNTTLVEFHKEVLANPAKVMDLVAPPSPVMKDGKMLGFRVMPGKNIALFNQTGLQPGDIVTKINGTAMDSPGAGIQALQNSMNSSNVNLEVDRGGQITPISVNF
jgi:general secretion pathway protein C